MNDDQTERSEEKNDQDNVDDRKILIKEHQHYLNLRLEDDNRSRSCNLCWEDIKSPFYDCDICNHMYYWVHKSCGDYSAQLPNKEINHPFHSSHGPLHLVYGQTDWCRSCHRRFENIPFYTCLRCDFKLDFRCAFMPDPTETIASPPQQQCTSMVKHISHQHPLLLIDDKDDANDDDRVITKCFACQSKLPGSGQAYYGCAPCGYFLDKFCAKFPREFQHPLHDPQHGLLILQVNTRFLCSVCEIEKYGPCNLGLKCQQCEFWLCWKCNITVKKNISYENHEHILCFVKEPGKTIGRCDGYDAYCRQSLVASHSKEFDLTKSSVFKCMDCDFKLHLLCGPLPSTIKYELHIHSLTLYDSFLEDNSGEYYCDVCETQRDPRIRVYCCVECKYFAHVHCLISEIVDYFYIQMGELDHSDVKLKVLGEEYWTKSSRNRTGLTLNDLLLQLPEKEYLKYYFKWDESWHKDSKVLPKDDDDDDNINVQLEVVGDEEINNIIEISRFTEESFMRYFEKDLIIWPVKKIKLEASELALKLVDVKSYMIPHSLAGILETLLDGCKNNMFPNWFRASLEMKSFLLFIWCKVVKRMRNTMVQDITTNLLQDWRSSLQFLQYYGLDIGFVIEKLEKATRAFIGHQASRLEREVPAILHSRMVELQSRISSCEEYRDSEKNEFMKGCLKEDSESMWKSAY